MNKSVEVTILYDYYKDLLTTKQRFLFEAYYFENLSLSEISENESISRNAVHKTIKSIEEKLFFFEQQLHLREKVLKLETLLKDYPKEFQEQVLSIFK